MGASEGCEWHEAWLVLHVIGLKKGRRVGWEVYQCQAPLLEGLERRMERRRAGLGVWRRNCWEELEAFGGKVGLPWWLRRYKRLSTMRETWVRSLGREDLLEKEMAIYSSTIAWKIPWTKEPGRLQSMGSQRVGHD